MTQTIGVVVMAYGGPDSLDDVEPYLLDVRGGRPMRQEMIDEMTERYRLIGGRSPILERTVAQAERLEQSLNASHGGPAYRCVVGMRHWMPRIETALSEMDEAGISKAVGLVMAPHYSRMSIGAYFEKVAEAGSPVEVA
ncbi:MAG: ferrochelatase, partial [Gemmatimonadales bacterium]